MTLQKATEDAIRVIGTIGETVKTEDSNFMESGAMSRQAARCTSSVNLWNPHNFFFKSAPHSQN